MIKPSEVNSTDHFLGGIGEWHVEDVARRVVVLSQAVAFAMDDDSWHSFTVELYFDYEEATGTLSRDSSEHHDISRLTEFGYFNPSADGSLTVTEKFLGMVANYPVRAADPGTR